jgi:hypothetical protein
MWTGTKGMVKELACTPFSIPIADLKSSMKGVCLFLNGTWQRVNLKYSGATDKVIIKPITSCDRGITVSANPQGSAVTGPTTMDCKSGKVFDASACDYQKAGAAAKPEIFKHTYATMVPPKRPINCLRNTFSKRVHANAKLCEDDPQASGYCDLVYLNTPKFKGSWWVQYGGKDQKSMQICKGGITMGTMLEFNAENVVSGQNNNYVKLVPEKTMLEISSFTTGSAPSYNPAANEAISSCLVQKFGKVTFTPVDMQRIQCSSEKCEDGESCADITDELGLAADGISTTNDSGYTFQLRASASKFAPEKHECFRHTDGKWYVITSAMKGAATLVADDFDTNGSKRIRRCYQLEVEVQR